MNQEEKNLLRMKIWKFLDDSDLIRGSKSAKGRIPNFKGANEAALNLRKTEEWQQSRTIFCSPDSAQREVRENALQDGKYLIVASPKLEEGYFLLDPDKIRGQEQLASTIDGTFKLGETLLKFPPVDLVVEGSVAVDKNGNRLGKGGGYGDQEISHLFKVRAIDESTPRATTVHESQVVEKVPTESHDQKLNLLVTPQQVIRTP
ncbi:MAG: 5-formyltetrahydrofolate cyclo-ligase [Methanobacteriaceae archaeon]